MTSQLPQLDGQKASIFASTTEGFRNFACHPHHRTSRGNDWLDDGDLPQLAVRQVNLLDATLLTLSFNHSLFDAMGQKELLDAWISVLNGREHEVLPVVGYNKDLIFQACGQTPMEKHILYSKMLGKSV